MDPATVGTIIAFLSLLAAVAAQGFTAHRNRVSAAREVENVVTRLKAVEAAQTRAENRRKELYDKIDDLGDSVRLEIGGLRQDLAELRGELRGADLIHNGRNKH